MKKYIILFILSFVLVLLSACGNDKIEESKPDNTNESRDTENWIGAGVLREKIDSQTIEIETAKEKEVYELTEAAQEDLGSLEVGEEISYSYHKDHEHHVIESIRGNEHEWGHMKGRKHKYDRHHPRYNKEHYDDRPHHRKSKE